MGTKSLFKLLSETLVIGVQQMVKIFIREPFSTKCTGLSTSKRPLHTCSGCSETQQLHWVLHAPAPEAHPDLPALASRWQLPNRDPPGLPLDSFAELAPAGSSDSTHLERNPSALPTPSPFQSICQSTATPFTLLLQPETWEPAQGSLANLSEL